MRNKEKEKLRFERFFKKGTRFPILLGLLYILNCLVFFVCWVLQMRKILVYGKEGLVRGYAVKFSLNPKWVIWPYLGLETSELGDS